MPVLGKPTRGTDCRLPLDCRPHHATGGAANGPVSGDPGGGQGGGGSGHLCLGDRDCGLLRPD
jgi:hypothetical protein